MKTDFQSIILNLQSYWAARGCVILSLMTWKLGQAFHPATTLRSLGQTKVWKTAYVQPSRRPTDGRYGENPNRLQHYSVPDHHETVSARQPATLSWVIGSNWVGCKRT